MGRHKMLKTTIAILNSGNLEKPKTVTVQAVTCPHCGALESKSVMYGDNRHYIENMGFRLDYMRCKSEECLSVTGGVGRPWRKRNYNF